MTVEGSGAMVEIPQGTGSEVGREGSGIGSGQRAKRKEQIGTEDAIDGCMVGLPFVVEGYPEGKWGWLCMAVVMNIAEDGEGRVVPELTQGAVHAVLPKMLR